MVNYNVLELSFLCLNMDNLQIVKAEDSIGPEVEKLVASLPDGGVLLLENVRFYKEEEKNDPEHAKKLASLADLYVNDAFGTAHRAHASTEGVTKYLKPSVAGFLLQKVCLSLLFSFTTLLSSANSKVLQTISIRLLNFIIITFIASHPIILTSLITWWEIKVHVKCQLLFKEMPFFIF